MQFAGWPREGKAMRRLVPELFVVGSAEARK